ncbi:Ig-like domain-containing protein [Aphis craccivora]|uniref:Ig-like domain-containing protein n=1 Tax=Aphis craccivora TaxID=307492 RepID=A0A6G0W8W0_APHCR|nr:Ig-like domain-containing protein [Aphis craccivora]
MLRFTVCSIMFWLNLSILLAIMGGEWCTPAPAEVVITARQNDGPLSHFDRGSSADDRSYLRQLRLWLKEMRADSSTGRPNDINKRPAARRRVTHRPKDIGGADTPEQVTSGSPNTAKSTVAKSTTTKSTAAARTLFSTEEECVSANKGRDCVCDMTDFLDLIVQRLDETVDDEDESAAVGALNCHSFKSVPTVFFVYPTTAADDLDGTTAATAAAVSATVSADLVVERNGGQSGGGHFRGAGVHVEKKTADMPAAPSWKEVDFDDIVNYRLEKSSDSKALYPRGEDSGVGQIFSDEDSEFNFTKASPQITRLRAFFYLYVPILLLILIYPKFFFLDHYTVQYVLVGSDAKVPCMINGNKTRMNAFRWDFKKNIHKTNSMVVGTDTNILLILGLEPGDSKNYTCIPTMVGDSRSSTSYRHDVVAVEKAIYEIRGSVVYKTRSGCTHEITVLVQKQLPSSMRNELCSEGSSRHACNVIVEKPKCAEDQRTMEIKYLVTLNDKANYLARIKTSKKGRIAQCYQKVLARISSVLASNLNKTLMVPSKYELYLSHTLTKVYIV